MKFGRYEVLGELGRGGMGVVYRARHPELQREVAVKVLLVGKRAAHRQRERFRLEAQATSRLRHPNIVSVHDFGEVEGSPYLVMDLVQGETLADRIASAPLKPREAARMIAKLARALHRAHETLILHRDVKPENVILKDSDEPVLTDFGLAKLVDEEQEGAEAGLTQAGQLVGTPAYMAPEQASSGSAPVDWRADVYSLGATFFDALVGRPPFVGDSVINLIVQVTSVEARFPPELLKAIPLDLRTACLKCLSKAPQDRYPSALALAEDLERHLAGKPILARPLGPVERSLRWANRNRALAGVAGLTLMTLIGMGGLASARVLEGRARLEVERVESEGQARSELLDRERALAEAAWREARDAEESPGQARTGATLATLQAAQRWRSLAPDDPRTLSAESKAARALSAVALQSSQWALAKTASELALGLGLEEAEVRAELARVEAARKAEWRRRRGVAKVWLDRARSGELAKLSDGTTLALLQIVQVSGPGARSLLVERLKAGTRALRRATAEQLRAAAPSPELEEALQELARDPYALDSNEVLRAASRRLAEEQRAQSNALTLMAAAQRERLGPGLLSQSKLCCEALGRMGGPKALAALSQHLAAELDQVRALPAALALARLGGEAARLALRRALKRFGPEGVVARQTRLLLRAKRPR